MQAHDRAMITTCCQGSARRVPPGSAGVSPALFHSFRPTRRRGRQQSQAYLSAIRINPTATLTQSLRDFRKSAMGPSRFRIQIRHDKSASVHYSRIKLPSHEMEGHQSYCDCGLPCRRACALARRLVKANASRRDCARLVASEDRPNQRLYARDMAFKNTRPLRSRRWNQRRGFQVGATRERHVHCAGGKRELDGSITAVTRLATGKHTRVTAVSSEVSPADSGR